MLSPSEKRQLLLLSSQLASVGWEKPRRDPLETSLAFQILGCDSPASHLAWKMSGEKRGESLLFPCLTATLAGLVPCWLRRSPGEQHCYSEPVNSSTTDRRRPTRLGGERAQEDSHLPQFPPLEACGFHVFFSSRLPPQRRTYRGMWQCTTETAPTSNRKENAPKCQCKTQSSTPLATKPVRRAGSSSKTLISKSDAHSKGRRVGTSPAQWEHHPVAHVPLSRGTLVLMPRNTDNPLPPDQLPS